MRTIALAFMASVFGAMTLSAADEQVPRFRSGVDIVALNVIVTDAQQRPVSGLAAEDFAVFEDGVQQDLSFFATSQVPLDLALLLDTSASMAEQMKTMQEAAVNFVSTLRPDDRVTIVDIKDTVKVVHPLNGDIAAASAAIRATAARGGTALYNAAYVTLKDLIKQRSTNGEVRRQAIAVLSDGEDTASLMSFDDVLETAKQAGVAVYTISLRSSLVRRIANGRTFSNADYSMRTLALETGGRAFSAADIGELAGIYGVIAEELANQYSLGYSSKNPKKDGSYRRVVVRVLQHGDARPRTRAGYVSASLQ